jgi:hypothetical protein
VSHLFFKEQNMTMNPNETETTGWIPLARAAEELGSTPLNVLMHIKRGLLTGAEQNGAWWVEADSLAMLVRRRSAGAQPSVCASACRKQGGCGSCA